MGERTIGCIESLTPTPTPNERHTRLTKNLATKASKEETPAHAAKNIRPNTNRN